MNNAKLITFVDELISEYKENKINATDLNSIRKALDTKIRASNAQIKYNQYMNRKVSITYFENEN